MSARENITRIRVVYDALQELASEVVFVGGATVSLYADREVGEVRPTDDVDVLVELMHHREYAAIEKKLRAKGFVNDVQSRVVCRYRVKGVVVDVMPTDERVLGFSNMWYKAGYRAAVTQAIDTRRRIKLFPAPYFVASKLEAFNNRGKGDGRSSSDFEDIVYILNNRSSIWNEIHESPHELYNYLRAQFASLLDNDYIDEWIGAHLEYSEQARIRTIAGEMRVISHAEKKG